jgi:RNA polymerase sigma factor (sigma-70 family)
MATKALNRMMQRLRRTTLLRESAGVPDDHLLECYVSGHDEAAFEALVRRHGPMVLGVCRRVLRNEADAEDAFQAVFLVLVRKAASIRCRKKLSNWLYGVAHNTALKARAMIHKRGRKEREAGATEQAGASEEMWQRVQLMLDAELSRLPDKYRVPIVLCELEGKPIKEAARQLGWPQGTLATRLARGRELLRRRLSDHGVELSGAVLAAALFHGSACARVPALLVSSTVKAAGLFAAAPATTTAISMHVAALTQGVLNTMLLTKLKIATGVLLAVLCVAVGAYAYRGPGQTPTQVERKVARQPQRAQALQQAGDEQPVDTLEPPKVLRSDKSIMSMAWSPDGKLLASVDGGGAVGSAVVTIRDVAGGNVERTLEAENGFEFRQVRFSPDGKTIAATSAGRKNNMFVGTIRVWDVATGQLKHDLAEDSNAVGLAFSPDGKTLASTSLQGKVRLWNLETGQVRRTIEILDTNVMSVAFSPDGKTVAAGGMARDAKLKKGEVTLWDVDTGNAKHSLTGHVQVWAIAFAPDGKTVAASGSGVKLWDVDSGELKHALGKAMGMDIAFAPHGRTLAMAQVLGDDKGDVTLWDTRTGKLKQTLEGHDNMVYAVAFSRDGRTLASGSRDQTIKLWRVKASKQKKD